MCTDCGAVFLKGRWTWQERPPVAKETTCPACRRITDDYPAGLVYIDGDLGQRRAEVLNLLRNVESAENAEHPLERIMHVRDRRAGPQVATTGIHLARRIGEAIQRAYHDRVQFDYLKEQDFLRVHWTVGRSEFDR